MTDKSTGSSPTSLKSVLANKAAFKQELILTGLLIPLAFWLGNDGYETIVLIASVILVLIIELLNLFIGNSVDRHNKERHDIPSRAKKIASTAVFLSWLNVVIVWALVLIN